MLYKHGKIKKKYKNIKKLKINNKIKKYIYFIFYT